MLRISQDNTFLMCLLCRNRSKSSIGYIRKKEGLKWRHFLYGNNNCFHLDDEDDVDGGRRARVKRSTGREYDLWEYDPWEYEDYDLREYEEYDPWDYEEYGLWEYVKRSTGQIYSEEYDNCCKHKINFHDVGWDWVLSPLTFDLCLGDCFSGDEIMFVSYVSFYYYL